MSIENLLRLMRWSTTNVTFGTEIVPPFQGEGIVGLILSRGSAPSSLAPGCDISAYHRRGLSRCFDCAALGATRPLLETFKVTTNNQATFRTIFPKWCSL